MDLLHDHPLSIVAVVPDIVPVVEVVVPETATVEDCKAEAENLAELHGIVVVAQPRTEVAPDSDIVVVVVAMVQRTVAMGGVVKEGAAVALLSGAAMERRIKGLRAAVVLG